MNRGCSFSGSTTGSRSFASSHSFTAMASPRFAWYSSATNPRRTLRRIWQVAEPGLLGEIQNALCLVIRFADLSASAGLRHFLLGLSELVVCVAKEDQPENRDGILRRFQFGVRPQFVGGIPEAFFKISMIRRHVGQVILKLLILAGHWVFAIG